MNYLEQEDDEAEGCTAGSTFSWLGSRESKNVTRRKTRYGLDATFARLRLRRGRRGGEESRCFLWLGSGGEADGLRSRFFFGSLLESTTCTSLRASGGEGLRPLLVASSTMDVP
jgi:hypothetical protein